LSLEFRHIAHSYGSNRALDEINLVAPEGEITCLLGSSGCGKSTLLNLAAGLLPVQVGEILIDDSLMADSGSNPPPEDRPVGMMFQDGALFPHMNVAENVAFGMAQRSAADVEAWLDHVGLGGLGTRYPHELSGGQQQRVALARAMAAEPKVLLMDEPFASVDIVLRRTLRRECRAILRTRGATVVLVTHDPEEALDISDRIAVMEAGQIVQYGTPAELYAAPKSARVGSIFHGAQIIDGVIAETGVETQFGVWDLASVAGDVPAAGACDLLLRKGSFDVTPAAGAASVLTLRDIRHQGASSQLVFANRKGVEFAVDRETPDPLEVGKDYVVAPSVGSILAFPKR